MPAAGARCGVHECRADLGVQVAQHLPVEHPAAYLRVHGLKRAHHRADARHPCSRSREIVTGRGRLVVGRHHSGRVEIGALWRSQRPMRAAGDHETELDVIRRTEYCAEASAVVAAGTAHRAAF